MANRLALAFTLLVWPAAVLATTIQYVTDAQLVTLADRVVLGRVLEVSSEWSDDGSRIYTVAKILVIEDLTGHTDPVIEVRELGGQIGDVGMYVGGAATYTVGEEVLVVLKEHGPGDLRSVAMAFSKFTVVERDGPDATLVRSLDRVSVRGAPAAGLQAPRRLSEFRRLVESEKGTAPFRPADGRMGLPLRMDEPFSLLGGPTLQIRWNEVDSGTTITWYKSTNAAPPISSGDAVSEIMTALGTWADPVGSAITLAYGGTTTRDGTETSPFSTPSEGVIGFEDPDADIDAPTLAVGGGWYTSAGAKTVNGLVFNSFTRGYVVFNNVAEIEIQSPTDFLQIAAHEIGHGIGLGHSDYGAANLMYFAKSGSTPVPPSLGNDDLAALFFTYPAFGRPLVPAGDYDGDNKSDVAVFRQSESAWYVQRSSGGSTGLGWGTIGDSPVHGDYDGDGITDVGVFRPSDGGWYIVRSSGGSIGVTWGAAGDLPVPADYDGDGKTDIAVFRPSTGGWFIIRSSGGSTGITWGTAGDRPVPADYDGDGKADVAVFRPSTSGWFVVRSSGGSFGLAWGTVGDTPVVADYDGDGKADIGVFRPSENAWFIVRSTGGSYGVLWGGTGDQPVFGDYDGDGKADITVFRPSTGGWFIIPSGGGPAIGTTWGGTGDLPV